jgi:mannose-1-phosphate guanylyltransferase/mannose-6-phosphate isomerase
VLRTPHSDTIEIRKPLLIEGLVEIVPIILCGGAGTRLWPASRDDIPKPFLPLVDGQTTFGMTLQRVADRTRFGSPVVVAGAGQRRLVEVELNASGVTATILIEPDRRDTAAAIGAGAVFAAARDPQATILVLAADHLIRDRDGFNRALAAALPAAENGQILVFGVQPTYPATAFGYIRPGELGPASSIRKVAGFVEKPDRARAEEFIADGFLWNSGIFLMRASTAIAELDRHAPEILAAAKASLGLARADGDAVLIDRDAFAGAPRRSFDYAVMERTDRAAVVTAHFDWSDVGTWGAVWEAADKDADGNVIMGDGYTVDTRNAYVASDRDRVGVVGLDDAVVIASDGAVLVTTRQQSATVKDLVAAMNKAPERVIGDFVRHFRPWGFYQSLDQGKTHQVKRIVVNPGARLSLQRHKHRAERWTVVQGMAEVTVGMDRESLATERLGVNGHIAIPKGAIHRMANPGPGSMTIIEVQIGDYLGEDDIERLEDDYGRTEDFLRTGLGHPSLVEEPSLPKPKILLPE